MTIEEKWEQYSQEMHLKRLFGHKPVVMQELQKAYLAGEKESGIVWHDLRKDPTDLPKGRCTVTDFDGNKVIPVLNQHGERVFFHKKDKRFKTNIGACTYMTAWAEIPKFEEN